VQLNKSAHVVLGVNLRGEKEVLELWLAENEGAKFWLSVLTDSRQIKPGSKRYRHE
jgi:transposase-like protein